MEVLRFKAMQYYGEYKFMSNVQFLQTFYLYEISFGQNST